MDRKRKWRCGSYTLPTYHGTTEGRDIQWYVLRFKMNAAEMDPLKNELFPVQLYLRRRSSNGRTKELGYRLSVFSDWHPMIDPLLFWCFEHVEYIEKVIPSSLCFYDTVTEKSFHCLSSNDLSDREWTRISLSETIYIRYKYKMLNFLKLRKGQTLVISSCIFHIFCQRTPAALTYQIHTFSKVSTQV